LPSSFSGTPKAALDYLPARDLGENAEPIFQGGLDRHRWNTFDTSTHDLFPPFLDLGSCRQEE
jgi:hypothetical protein